MLLAIVLVIVLIAIGDAVWIGSNMKMYRTVTEAVQKQPMVVDRSAAALAYVCLFVLLYCYALPNVRRHIQPFSTLYDKLVASAYYGGGLGLMTYGIYNFTTKAILANYTWKVAVLDTLWGGLLATLVCLIVVLSTQ
jgi:uncharacterized membrane protein